MKNIYYVYIYLDPRKPGNFKYQKYKFEHEPFYVGKGKGLQHLSHLRETELNTMNKYKYYKIRNIQIESTRDPVVLKIQEDLSEEEAFILEKYLIENIGRLDKDLGPLLNLTDGGDGTSGFKHSGEDKRKMSIEKLGDKNPMKRPEVAKKQGDSLRGRTSETYESVRRTAEKVKEIWEDPNSLYHSKERRSKASQRMKNGGAAYAQSFITEEGRKRGAEKNSKRMVGDNNPMKKKSACLKLSKTRKERKLGKENEAAAELWIVISPSGSRQIIKNLAKFCRSNNLNPVCMNNVSSGKQNSHKEWKCEHVKDQVDNKMDLL